MDNMQKNECETCGGGFDGYTAPEARCRCKEEAKHEMLLAETKYLKRSGWEPVDHISLAEGSSWKAPTGDGPISQAAAVDIQKQLDRRPAVRGVWLRGITTTTLRSEMKDAHETAKMQIAEMKLRHKVHC